jgi:hypothetical protein
MFNCMKQLRIYLLYLVAFGTGNKHGDNAVRSFTEKIQTLLYFCPVQLPFSHDGHSLFSIPVNPQCKGFMFNTHLSAGIAHSDVEFSLCSFLLNCADVSLTVNGLMPHAKRKCLIGV